MFKKSFIGDIPHIINNFDNLYQGDLRPYARVIFNASNIYHGYHGLRHMLHVTWVCYQACSYYGRLRKLTPREMRNLLIAAMFHDYGHVGKQGDDVHNITAAIKGLRDNLLAEDEQCLSEIELIIEATQFPHSDLSKNPKLEQLIIRDADMSQAFGPAWIGEILTGLGSELGKSPREMLEQQLRFLQEVHFHTDFGKVFFGTEAIKAKIAEAEAILDIIGD